MEFGKEFQGDCARMAPCARGGNSVFLCCREACVPRYALRTWASPSIRTQISSACCRPGSRGMSPRDFSAERNWVRPKSAGLPNTVGSAKVHGGRSLPGLASGPAARSAFTADAEAEKWTT